MSTCAFSLLIVLLTFTHCLACHPQCKWLCDDPVCSAVCEPECQAPRCEVTCLNTTADPRSVCSHPICWTTCGDTMNQCESDNCPQCETRCGRLYCQPSYTCQIQCEMPQCGWKCRKPDSCPKPQCQLMCEQPACKLEESSATHSALYSGLLILSLLSMHLL